LASIPISFVIEPRGVPGTIEASEPDSPAIDLNLQARLAAIVFLATCGALGADRVMAPVVLLAEGDALLVKQIR
jgi:hypothetical protein